MSTSAPDSAKPPVASSSRQIAADGNPFANLLSQADLGIKITGLVTAKDEPRHVSGTSKTNKPYSFWNLRATVLAGADTVEVTIRKDEAEKLPVFDVFTVRKFRVVGVRVNNGLPSYDVELDA